MGCWLTDSWLCLSRCCKSCSGVTLAHIKITPCYYPDVLSYPRRTNLLDTHFFFPRAACCKKKGRERRWCMRTHSSHCACAPESCVYFPPPLRMQALFCASVLRATSWGSLQASCLRSQRLSADSAPLRATQVHAAVSSDDSGSERHILACPGISGRPQKAFKKSNRKNSSAKFPFLQGGCFSVRVPFFFFFTSVWGVVVI